MTGMPKTVTIHAAKTTLSQLVARVEAGAQGEHKIARGYEPVATWSAHYIADPKFRHALEDYVRRERNAVEDEIAYFDTVTPFRKD